MEERRQKNNSDDWKLEEERDGIAATAPTTTTRIFVGGLGESVTEDDLRKTFSSSSMGKVESIDIVRTKGRSLAYLDFLPTSDKGLSKLFSTYKGCMWKGGRLRLEKAKEHYLVRLRREWEEHAKLATDVSGCNVDRAENLHSSEKLKKVSGYEKMKLQIFFPKLKKVKSIPFSGTGKHKYSFQRVEIPSLPVHFCDCEEHSDPADTAKGKPAFVPETENGGINEEELNLMHSVMNKLFEREQCSKATCYEGGIANSGDNAANSIDDLLVDGKDSDSVTDEDNLIINMVVGEHDKNPSPWTRRQKIITSNQGSVCSKAQTSLDRSDPIMRENQKKQKVRSNEKRKLPIDGNELVSAVPEKKRSLQATLRESETVLEAQTTRAELGTRQEDGPRSDGPDVHYSADGEKQSLVKRGNSERESHQSGELKEAAEAPPVNSKVAVEKQYSLKQGNSERESYQCGELKEAAAAPPANSNVAVNKSTRGASWLQKSSWTQLVGDTSRSSFNISQILPNAAFREQEPLPPIRMDTANSIDSEQNNLFKPDRCESARDGSTAPSCTSSTAALAKREQNPAVVSAKWTSPEKKRESDGVFAPLGRKDTQKQTSAVDFGVGETCTFMRSAASMREWTKVKAALTGSLKKKGDGK